MPEYLDGCSAATQLAEGTAAGDYHWLPFMTKFDLTETINTDIPAFLLYQLWREISVNPTTRIGNFDVEGYVDPVYFGWWIAAMCGTPTGSDPYVFLGGSSAAPLLTLARVDANVSTFLQLINGIPSDLELSIDAKGVIKFTCKGIGLLQDPQSSPPTPDFTATAPTLAPWQCVVSRGGSARGILAGKLVLQKMLNPLHETPVVAPGAGDTAGVPIKEIEVNGAKAGYEFTTRYTDYATSDWKDLRTNADQTHSVDIHDPNASGAGWLFEMNACKATEGGLESKTSARAQQRIGGRALYKADDGTGLIVSGVNDGDGYDAS